MLVIYAVSEILMANTPVFVAPNFPPERVETLSPVLSSGDFHHGDNLEKMSTASSSAKLYSFRLNRKSRVMMARVVVNGVSSWLLIEELTNHNYQDAQSLKKGWLDRYLEKHEKSLANEHRELLIALQDKAQEPVGELEYHNEHWIVLSEAQNQAHCAKYPLIVPGMPGTGKSVLALSLLKRELGGDDNDADDVLYVTKSKELTDRMRVILDDTPELEAKPAVLDFASLPAEMRSQAAGGATGETECIKWLAQAKLKLSWKALGYESAERFHRYLYREFRILSGCADEAAYLALGRRQSLFDEQDRAEIYKIYASYIKSEEGRRDYSLVRIKPTTDKRYKAIFVDESQDFSDAELLDLYDLCDGRIVYFIDSNQSLLDVHSKIDVLKRRLGRELTVIVLPHSFRCSHAVTRAANALLNVKHCVMGGVLEKNAATQVTNHAGAEEGQAIWIEHRPNESTVDRTDLDILKQTMNSTQRIVITWPKYFAEVKRLFPGAIVATPEHVKGLEFDEVMAYHLLDEEHFTDISRLLSSENAPAFFEKGSRAKADNDRRELGPDLNQVFTAFTRARKKLYVMEDSKNHKTISLMQSMKKAFTEDQIKTSIEVSSPEEWLKRAEKYIKEKRYELAQQICDTHLGVGMYASLLPGPTAASSCASTTDAKQMSPAPSAAPQENNPGNTSKRITNPNKSSKPVVARPAKKINPLPVASPMTAKDQKTINNKLIKAICAGNLEEVKKLIEQGADPHYQLMHHLTPILFAAQLGHLAIVEYLHKRGCDLLNSGENGHNVLSLAISMRHLPLVKYCHQQGMNLNLSFKAPLDLTPLVVAIGALDLAIVQYLCDSGANPNEKTKNGILPLIEALVSKDFKLVQCLCENGANVNLTGYKNEIEITPMEGAVLNGELHVVKYLHSKGARLDRTSHQSNTTPLHLAAVNGFVDIAHYLAKHSSWINSRTETEETPLISAAQYGNESIVDKLLDCGADIYAKTDEEATALHYAAHRGHLPVVINLKAHGMDLNTRGKEQVTAIHLAIIAKKLPVVNYLIDAGVNLNLADSAGETPAHYAARDGLFGVIGLLARAGADLNVLNSNDQSPVHVAKDNYTLKMLKNSGANVDINATSSYRSPLFHAVAQCDFSRAQCLVEECGASPRPADKDDLMSPMFIALLSGALDFVALFLKNRTDPAKPYKVGLEFFSMKKSDLELQNKLNYLLKEKEKSSTASMINKWLPFFKSPAKDIELTENEIVWLMSRENLYSLFPVPDYLKGYTSPVTRLSTAHSL